MICFSIYKWILFNFSLSIDIIFTSFSDRMADNEINEICIFWCITSD